MRRTWMVAALVLVSLLACGKKKAAPSVLTIEGESAVLPRVERARGRAVGMRVSDRTLTVLGRERSFLLVLPPAQKPDARMPLVLVFHGDGGSAKSFHGAVPFENASGVAAVIAYPDGIGSTWDLETTDGNRDVAFVEALVEHLASIAPIDRARVFATGYSSGGFLANVVACQKSGLLRAIASSAGGAPYNQAEKWPNRFPKCPGQAPTATLALHGRRDFGVTIDSGRFTAEYWAYVNGCNTAEMETTGYDECHAYRGCPPGKNVLFCEIPELGHWVWDRADEAAWTFFERQ